MNRTLCSSMERSEIHILGDPGTRRLRWVIMAVQGTESATPPGADSIVPGEVERIANHRWAEAATGG